MMKLRKTFFSITIVLLTISSFMSVAASDSAIYTYKENSDLQPLSGTVFWTMEPSSIELHVQPGHSADIIITISNDASSDSYWQCSGTGFGEYYDTYMTIVWTSPPMIAPGDSWTGPIGTIYVNSTTPVGTVCTAPDCRLDIDVFNGEPPRDSIPVTVIATDPIPLWLLLLLIYWLLSLLFGFPIIP